jgi:hypothetical protein
VEMTLYKVGTNGRVALGELADGVEYFAIAEHIGADGTKDGALILTPLRIVTPTSKRSDPHDAADPYDPQG